MKSLSVGHGIEKRKDPEMVLCGLYTFIAQKGYRKP